MSDNSTNDNATPSGIITQTTSTDSSVKEYRLDEENQGGWMALYIVTITAAVLGNLLFIGA